MNSPANSAGADASVINLELNTLEQPISPDEQTDAVLDAVVVQAMYEEIPAESRLSSPLLKILGISALSGAALSLVTPLMGWQAAKLLPTLGADDSDGASDVDGIDWVAPPPTESKPQVSLAETPLPSFVTRANGPTLSGQARLPLPSSQFTVGTPSFSASPPSFSASTPNFSASPSSFSTSPPSFSANPPSFSTSLPSSRPAFDWDAFVSTNIMPSGNLAAPVTPQPIESDTSLALAPEDLPPASEAPAFTLPDQDSWPVRQGRPVTVQATNQHRELPTLAASVEPVRIATLPETDTVETAAHPLETAEQMSRDSHPVLDEAAISGETALEETTLEDAALEDAALEDESLAEIYDQPVRRESPQIMDAAFTDAAFDEAAPVSVILFPQESVSPVDEVAADEVAADQIVSDNLADAQADYAEGRPLSERLVLADTSSVFLSTDAQILIEELVVDNPDLLSTAIAEQGELVVSTETGDILIEALSVDEVFPIIARAEEDTLPQRLTTRSGSNEQLIATQIEGEAVVLSVTHLSSDESLITASAHQRLVQELGKQNKPVVR
ncbi:MAG: hypothetical protein AAF921_22340 [Cyanobacteria bacterium P01_D01_bin.44]